MRPLPIPAHVGTPERLLEFASVQLFVDRSQSTWPDFQLTPRNAEYVAGICAKLEGLPLALELAAAWSSALSPAQVLERLSQRFDLLVSRRAGRLSRHQTLRAAIEWSYQLLTPKLQEFFVHLSVFRGGWTAEAVESVCQQSDAIELLRALRDRSLVTVDEVDAGDTEVMRFRLLESLREFAADRLSPEERDSLRRRHLAWYSRWADHIRHHLTGSQQGVWLQRVGLDRENVLAALDWSLEDEAGSSDGLRLLACLHQFWCLQGNYGEVRSAMDRLLAHAQSQDASIWTAHCLRLGGTLACYQGDLAAAEDYFIQCLEVAREWGDARLVAVALLSLGDIAVTLGSFEIARGYFAEALQQYQQIGYALGVAAMYGAFGTLTRREGDHRGALSCFVQSVEIQRQEHNLSGITYHLFEAART